MRDLISTLLPEIKSHRLLNLNPGEGIIYPGYHGFSLQNLPASVCTWLGYPGFGTAPLDERYTTGLAANYRQVVLLLVDGVGLDLFLKFCGEPPWLQRSANGLLAHLTSIVPSTTATALTSLWTGAEPAAHGVLGYEMWLKEYGLIANMILQSAAAFNGDVGGLERAGFSPQTFLPIPTLGKYLSGRGVGVFTLQPVAIARSGLSKMLLADTNNLSYRNLSDLWITLDELLEKQRGQPTYVYGYWSDIDELSHRYGPEDKRVLLEFDTFSRTLSRFIDRKRMTGADKTLLVVAADHGQISTPLNPEYELRRHPALLDDLVMPPSGENRLPYFFLRPGRENHARDYIERVWPGEFQVETAAAVLNAGLFGGGPAYSRVPERLGDWVIFPERNAFFWWADKANPLLGRHGGLSPQEMLVPLWALEI